MARLTRFQQAQAANMLLQASAQLQAAAPKTSAAASSARSFGPGHGTAGPSGRSVLNQDPNSPRYGQRFVERIEHLDDGAHIVHDYGDHVIDIGPMKGVARPLAAQTLPTAATTLSDALSALANANGIGQAPPASYGPQRRRF